MALRGPDALLPKYVVNGKIVDENREVGLVFHAVLRRRGPIWSTRRMDSTLAPHGPILDIGAGDGLLIEALGSLDLEYLGVDFAPETVSK